MENEIEWTVREKARFYHEMDAEAYMLKNFLENGFYRLDSKDQMFVVYNEETI